MHQTEKWARNMDDPAMRGIANSFLAECQEKNLTYAEMQTLLTSLKLRLEHKVDEEKTGAANEALGREARIKRY